VPIPGTKHVKYMKENAAATEIKIQCDDLQLASEIFSQGAVQGPRYAKEFEISPDPEE
jgi:aryl-alcohol dehydrogenase-like predicted oxidoreductase